MTPCLCALLACALVLAPRQPPPPDFDVDVLVYGGTSGGVIAAYTAQTYGKRVLLVEPGRRLGGMSSGGLGQTDIGNKYAVTGLGLDFYRRMGAYYGAFEAWQFEPKAAEQVFESYVDEAGVEVLFSRRLKQVQKAGAAIQTITLEYAGQGAASRDLVVRAKIFIDATYEGDLLAKAGVSYAVGREADSVYGETLGGVQLMTGHQMPDGIDPYRRPGDPTSGLLPEISGVGVEPNGAGDRKVQAYNFRMTLCEDPARRLPITRPDGYDPARYELLIRLMEKRPWTSLHDGFIISRMPNGKTDWNNRGGFSTDFIGKNWEYPEADYDRRAAIRKAHEDYQKGLLYFIATDARVPERIRQEMQAWGVCRDEFLDTGGWPHQLYVREARRLIGEYVMTEHNCVGRETVEDGIGMAAYTMDSHNVQRVVVQGPSGPMVKNEGNVEVGGFPPYPIAYRAITPKRTEATNLLAPVALSASHIAYGSIRMEPVFMVLGQSAAVAAVMAIDAGKPVQQIDVAALQRELRENPLADGRTPEVLVDDQLQGRVEMRGAWARAQARGQYGLSMARAEGDGVFRFLPEVRRPGRYKVYLYWPRDEALATNVPVEIRHAEGAAHLTLNQRSPSQQGIEQGLQHGLSAWVLLGEHPFAAGGEAYVQLTASAGAGPVVADALLLVPAPER